MIIHSDAMAAAARRRVRAEKEKQLTWARRRGAAWGARRPRVYWDISIGGRDLHSFTSELNMSNSRTRS
jgi:hypothetical protein